MAKIYKKNMDVLSALCPPSALEIVRMIKERKLVAIVFDCDHCLFKKTIDEIAKEKTGVKIILVSRNTRCSCECLNSHNKTVVSTLREAFNYIPRETANP
ncbi:MAG: hypothetical protein WC229_02155 [Candidatus Paceibacterota bacterium]